MENNPRQDHVEDNPNGQWRSDALEAFFQHNMLRFAREKNPNVVGRFALLSIRDSVASAEDKATRGCRTKRPLPGPVIRASRPSPKLRGKINGRSYVDIETLARLMNGSLSFKGNEIMLTLPAFAASMPTAAPPASQPVNSEFSKDFLKAGIEAMSVVREWRSALGNAVQNGYPVTDDLVAGYRAQAAKNLRLVSVAVSTDSDRNAFELLSNELDNMQKLNDKFWLRART